MSALSSVHSHSLNGANEHPPVNTSTRSGCFGTACKVAATIAAVFAAIGSALCCIFKPCFSGSHNHSRVPPRPAPVHVHVGGGHESPRPAPIYVPVRRGHDPYHAPHAHLQDHVVPGGGHESHHAPQAGLRAHVVPGGGHESRHAPHASLRGRVAQEDHVRILPRRR